MCAKGIRAFPLSLVALHHRSIHLFGGCCLRRLTRRFMDIHHTDLRLALGLVMATISIGLFVSASHPTVTSDARETGDRPTHWSGLLYRNHSKEATSGRTPSYNTAVLKCQMTVRPCYRPWLTSPIFPRTDRQRPACSEPCTWGRGAQDSLGSASGHSLDWPGKTRTHVARHGDEAHRAAAPTR